MVLRSATAGGISPIVRILYLGLPLGALHLAGHGYVPKIVALGHPDAPGARRVRGRLGASGSLVLGRPDLDEGPIEEVVSAARPDVILSWFWPRRIPSTILAMAPRGAFGVHPSLLPRWRGPDPYFWTLRAGDETTGVTLHRLDEGYDTGAIIARRAVDIAPDDDAWSLARRLDRPGLALLVEAASRLARGEALAGTAQDAQLATHAPAPTPEDLAIDWRASVDDILRLVRAAARGGASADFGGVDVEVLRAERYGDALPRALDVAEARCVEGGVAVRASDGAVLVSAVTSGDARFEGASLHRFFA
jgi:methionyl-tRNA formyltransferase